MELEVARHWYRTEGLANGVTLIYEAYVTPDLRCNIWHIRGRDRDALVDSGLGVVSLKGTVAQLAGREVLAIASHTHFDHIGNHHEFAQRLCHAAEAEVLAAPDADNTVWSAFQQMCDVPAAIDALPHVGFRFDAYAVRPAPPTRLIAEGDVVELGDRHLRVFHMPGHSPGSICLHEAATATLFCGDVLYDGELLDSLYHSDPEVYAETLVRLREIPAETFHCGHFGSFGRGRALELIDAYHAARLTRSRPA